MTVRVNLLPAEYMRQARRDRRAKIWLMLCVTLIGVQVALGLFLGARAGETRRILKATGRLQSEEQDFVRKLAVLTAEKRSLAREVALAGQLGRKHVWSRVLTEVAGHLPENAVLTKLESNPPRDTGAGGRSGLLGKTAIPSKGEKAEDGRGGMAIGFNIDGIATDHESVAEFLRNLSGSPLFKTCELQSTSRQPFMGAYGVRFTIRTYW